MPELLQFVPYPYVTLLGESLCHASDAIGSPYRLFCTGDVTFKTKHASLARVLSEKLREEWLPAVAREMARLVIQRAKVNSFSPDLYVSASSLPAL